MDRIKALRELLAQTISTMEYNIAQYERVGGNWPWPGTYEETKGRLQGYREIHHIIRK